MRLHCTFEQQKGPGLIFFSFGAIAAYGPKTRKKPSLDPFHENMVWKVYTAKISGAYQLSYESGPIFFSVV